MSSPTLLSVFDSFSRCEGAGKNPVASYSPMELKTIPVCLTSQQKKASVPKTLIG